MQDNNDLQALFLKCEKRLIQKAKRKHHALQFAGLDVLQGWGLQEEARWRECLIAFCDALIEQNSDINATLVSVNIAQETSQLRLQSNIQQPFSNTSLALAHLKQSVTSLDGNLTMASDSICATLPLPRTRTSLHHGKVLLADDHPDNLFFTQRLLTQMGYEVVTACNGQQAVEATMVDDFQLIFLDIQMPIMDGLEALELMQATATSCPVIALTANVMPHEVAEYVSLGFTACLAKPIDRVEFAQLVKRFAGLQQIEPFESLLQSDDYQQMVTDFKRGLGHYERELLDAFRQNDMDRIARLSHSLKGTGGNFGFHDITQAASRVEEQVKNSDSTFQEWDFNNLIDLLRFSNER